MKDLHDFLHRPAKDAALFNCLMQRSQQQASVNVGVLVNLRGCRYSEDFFLT